MTTVTVFGTGKMGSAIAAIFAAGGADVEHVTSTVSNAVLHGDPVVLAVPYPALADIVDRYGDQLAGRIVIDVTNPIDWATFGLRVPADSSAAAELQRALPAARVLKGFNTTFAATLSDPDQAVVLLAGDDEEAKSTVVDLLAAGGFSAVDAGSLANARELEAYAHLQIRLAMSGRISRLAVLPA